jgi:hypothetical protein
LAIATRHCIGRRTERATSGHWIDADVAGITDRVASNCTQLTTATCGYHAGRLQLNIRSSRTCTCTEKHFRPNRTVVVVLSFADLNNLTLQKKKSIACMPNSSCVLGGRCNHQPGKRLQIPGEFLLFYAYFLFRSSRRGVPPAANPREPPRISHARSPERALPCRGVPHARGRGHVGCGDRPTRRGAVVSGRREERRR